VGWAASPLGSAAWRRRGSSPEKVFRSLHFITDSVSCNHVRHFHLESGSKHLRVQSSRKFENATDEYGRSTAQASKQWFSRFQMKLHFNHHLTKFSHSSGKVSLCLTVHPVIFFLFFPVSPFMASLQLIQKPIDRPWAMERPYS
jgi:hypothetical protein